MATITPGDYAYNKTFYINRDYIDERLTNYPVRVLLTSLNFDFTEPLSASGGDIIFTTNDGVYTVLDFEEAYYDAANELAEYHVLMATVSHVVFSSFKMFWGRTGQTSQQNPTAVWDSNYVAVYHLGAGTDDSTSNSNDGTPNGTTVLNEVMGKIRDFNGTTDYIQLDGLTVSDTNNITIQAWAQHNETNYIIDIQSGRIVLGWDSVQNIGIYDGTWLYSTVDISGISAIAAIIEQGSTKKIYINGIETGENAASTKSIGGSVNIGTRYDETGNFYDGSLQDIRISNIARSDAWIKADYYNLSDQLLTIEKGKIIKITFDKDIQLSSLTGNEDKFTIGATQKRFVPGGDDVATVYTVESLDLDGLRIKKTDFLGGHSTYVVAGDDLKLEGGPGEAFTVGPTNYNTTNDTGANMGHCFTIVNNSYKFNSVRAFSETNETVYWALKSQPTGNWDPNAGTIITSGSKTLPANIYDTIDINETLAPGDYWFGWTSGANDLRYITGTTYPYTTGDISVIKMTAPGGSPVTTAWYNFFSFSFSLDNPYQSNGSWAYAFDCDDIKSADNGKIAWSETTPTGTGIIVYTALSTDGDTIPSTGWVEQTNNGAAAQSITENEDLTGKFLWVKINLSTTDDTVTPVVDNPDMRVTYYTDRASIVLLISGWAGFNKAAGDISIEYDGDLGTLAGDAAGHGQVADFTGSFTPDGLRPIHDPGLLEAIEAALTDYAVTRTLITFIDGFEPAEAIEATLTGYEITRTHVDDLPP